MRFPIYNFLIIFVLGIILLYSYYYYAVNTKNILQLWGRIKKPLLYIYYLSMIISAISFLLLIIYLILSDNFNSNQINLIFYSIIGIVFFSLFWMPLSIEYLKNPSTFIQYAIYFDLFLVAISTFYLLYILYNIKDDQNKLLKNLAFWGMIYFFIHVFFFDLILWTYNFF